MDLTEGTVTVPVAGKIKKAYVLVPAGAALAYVTYRWYQARQDAAATDTPATSDGVYTTPDQSEYGQSTAGGPTTITGNTGSTVTDGTGGLATNADWSNLAIEKLTTQGYDGVTVSAALGDFLARHSLTPSEATIVRAALAVAGQPPVGGPFPVLEAASTGNTTLPAPTGLHVVSATDSSVTLGWNKVDGAGYYRVYRSGASTNVGATDAANTKITITGLTPSTEYTWYVAADTTTHKPGPKSAGVKGKTKDRTLAKPTGLHASAITRTSFRVTCSPVKGAEFYKWMVNGRETGATDAPYRDFTGMHPHTSYTVTVRADLHSQAPGPISSPVHVKTKK